MSVDDDLAELNRLAGETLKRSKSLVQIATKRDPRRLELPVSIQRESANRKLAPQRRVLANNGRIRNEPVGPFVVSTYVSIAATCPTTCPFRSGGCYAIAGSAHLNGHALDRAAKGWPADEVSMAEARAIDALWREGVPQDGAAGGRDLRLHVAGEVSSARGAQAIGEAVDRYVARGGGRAWTFTHRWREITRARWGRKLSVLASCETVADVELALERGYVPAVTVDRYPNGPRAFVFGAVRAVPCPAEVSGGKTTCSKCRLCLDDGALRRKGLAIAFAVHGSDAAEAAEKAASAQAPRHEHAADDGEPDSDGDER